MVALGSEEGKFVFLRFSLDFGRGAKYFGCGVEIDTHSFRVYSQLEKHEDSDTSILPVQMTSVS